METSFVVLLFFVGAVLGGTDQGEHSETNAKVADVFLKKDHLAASLEMTPSQDCTEGDMQLSAEQKEVYVMMRDVNAKNRARVRRAAQQAFRLWPDQTFVYYFDPDLSVDMRSKFEEAVNAYRLTTCINFVEAKEGYSGAVPPVFVTGKGTGCFATVGGPGGKINLEENRCDHFGVCLHEIGHSLGFYHEQTRTDRDEHIIVKEDNIMQGYASSFKKVDRDDPTMYDLQSVMHYSADAYSKDGYSETIIPLDPNVKDKMGKQQMLSRLDTLKVNRIYNCLDKCPPDLGQRCQHGGVPSKYCTCICPDEYIGPYCEIFKGGSTCSVEYKRPSDKILSPGFPERYPSNSMCIYAIECDQGQHVSVTFKTFDVEGYGCFFDYLEIKMGKIVDEIYPDMYCDTNLEGKTLVSKSNLALLKFVSDDLFNYVGYEMDYTCQE